MTHREPWRVSTKNGLDSEFNASMVVVAYSGEKFGLTVFGSLAMTSGSDAYWQSALSVCGERHCQRRKQ